MSDHDDNIIVFKKPGVIPQDHDDPEERQCLCCGRMVVDWENRPKGRFEHVCNFCELLLDIQENLIVLNKPQSKDKSALDNLCSVVHQVVNRYFTRQPKS